MYELTRQSTQHSIPKDATGIEGFDAITIGGIPKGRPTLVAGSSGSAKTVFAIQYLIAGIEQFDSPAVFVTFEETPADIRRNVKSFGWDIEAYEQAGQWAFVDASPDPDMTATEAGAYDFSALIVRIEHAIDKVGAKRAAIDSVSALFSQYSDPSIVRRELFRMSGALKGMGITAMITAERTAEYGEVARFGVEEFAADNVVILRNVLEGEKRRRTVEVLKLRGAPHQKGEYPFAISNNGIEVLPLSAMELTQKSTTVRISTGNEKLDEMCGGGFFRDSIILASGATGNGKTLMVTTFLDQGCRDGEKVLIFAFEESREQLLRNAIGWGMDFRQWEEKGLLKVICVYPESVGLEDHLLSMKREVDAFNPNRIAVDSLSALERVSTVRSFREFVIGLTSFIKDRETAGLFTATTNSLMGGTSVTEAHISTITDSIILMRYVEMMGEMRRGLTVLKMRGSLHDKAIREYTIDGTGYHIGESFSNVTGGILSGSPVQVVRAEMDQLGAMFEK